MINDLKVSQAVQGLVFSLQKDLNQSLIDLKELLGDSEWEAYRLAIAHIMYELFHAFSAPLNQAHPELELKQNKEGIESVLVQHGWPMDNVLQRILKGKACFSCFLQPVRENSKGECDLHISDLYIAFAIEALMFFFKRALYQSQLNLYGTISNNEWLKYCEAVTCVVAEINLRILMPLYAIHPELGRQTNNEYLSGVLADCNWPEDNILQRMLEKTGSGIAGDPGCK